MIKDGNEPTRPARPGRSTRPPSTPSCPAITARGSTPARAASSMRTTANAARTRERDPAHRQRRARRVGGRGRLDNSCAATSSPKSPAPAASTATRIRTPIPIWSIGWDHRSLILMVLDGGKWHAYRLPKASHSYDGAHGWNTEWPRIRDIGEKDLLMTMHGMFWRFPEDLLRRRTPPASRRARRISRSSATSAAGTTASSSAATTPRESEFLNAKTGEDFSPPRAVAVESLVHPADNSGSARPGPRPRRGLAARGREGGNAVRAVPVRRLSAADAAPGPRSGAGGGIHPGDRSRSATEHGNPCARSPCPPTDPRWWISPRSDKGEWIRIRADSDCHGSHRRIRLLQSRSAGNHSPTRSSRASPQSDSKTDSLLRLDARPWQKQALAAGLPGRSARTRNRPAEICYELDAEMKLRPLETAPDPGELKLGTSLHPRQTQGRGLLRRLHRRAREPTGVCRAGPPRSTISLPIGIVRLQREISTERYLFNCHGTFYELPTENAGGFAKIRPVSSHNRLIGDFASYRGLLVMTGIESGAAGPAHHPLGRRQGRRLGRSHRRSLETRQTHRHRRPLAESRRQSRHRHPIPTSSPDMTRKSLSLSNDGKRRRHLQGGAGRHRRRRLGGLSEFRGQGGRSPESRVSGILPGLLGQDHLLRRHHCQRPLRLPMKFLILFFRPSRSASRGPEDLSDHAGG